MGSFAELRRRQRRLVMLQLLDACEGREASDDLIFKALPASGLASSVDAVRADLAWLDEQGLVNVRESEGVTFGKITARGSDVASDRAHVPGVERPGP